MFDFKLIISFNRITWKLLPTKDIQVFSISVYALVSTEISLFLYIHPLSINKYISADEERNK